MLSERRKLTTKSMMIIRITITVTMMIITRITIGRGNPKLTSNTNLIRKKKWNSTSSIQ